MASAERPTSRSTPPPDGLPTAAARATLALKDAPEIGRFPPLAMLQTGCHRPSERYLIRAPANRGPPQRSFSALTAHPPIEGKCLLVTMGVLGGNRVDPFSGAQRMSRRYLSVVVALAFLTGCEERDARSVLGVWENGNERVVIRDRGFGEGRVLTLDQDRPFTWKLGDDGRIVMEFGESAADRTVMNGRLNENGSLVVSLQNSSTSLKRTADEGTAQSW